MRRSALLALVSIFLLSLYLRLQPLTGTLYWGADYGEYYYLSRELVTVNHMSPVYFGWGVVYPDFPGMEILGSSMSIMSNTSLELWINLVAPLMASLVAVFVFLIGYEIFRDERIGLVAAGFVAVVLPHVYPTSHPMPGSVGDLLFVVGLLLLVKMQRNQRLFVPLVIVSLALVLTHHLSTYFLLICAFAALFVKTLYSKNRNLVDFKLDFAFLGTFSAIILLYWSIAPNFKDKILSHFFPWWFFIAIIPVSLGCLALFVVIRTRLGFSLNIRYPGFRLSLSSILAILVAVLVITSVLVVFGIPGTTMTVHPYSLVIFLPLFVFMAFAGFGRDYWQFYRGGTSLVGWLLAIAASLIFGAIFAPEFLIPYRHVEYISIPVGLLAGLGLVFFADFWTAGNSGIDRDKARGRRKKWSGRTAAVLTLAVFLLLANSFTAYPSRDLMLGYQEGTGVKSMEAVMWTGERTSRDAVVASDHRLSSIAFGFSGRNSTWDRAPLTLKADSFEEARAEMLQVELPSGSKRIDYVLLDDDVESGAILLVWDVAEPLSQQAIEKFEGSNYTKVFDNGFSQLYMVNW
jgi:hypothetical protein